MSKYLIAVFLVLVCLAPEAWCQYVSLYSDEDFQYFGTGAIGQSRSQRFTPTTSTPNSLLSTDFFLNAGMYVKMGVSGESASVELFLYQWNTDWATTIGGTVLASAGPFAIGTTEQWIEVVPAAPLTANTSYLLRCRIISMTYVSSGFGVRRSNSDDGGPGNQAYNEANPASSREYQVRLLKTVSVEDWSLY